MNINFFITLLIFLNTTLSEGTEMSQDISQFEGQSSFNTRSFLPILEKSPEEILEIRKISICKPPKSMLIIQSHGQTVITFKNIDYLSEKLINVPDIFEGQIPEGIINIVENNRDTLEKAIDIHNAHSKEFIFTGYKKGGKIALAAAAYFSQAYLKIIGQKAQPNQIKLITFCAGATGDNTFNRFMKNKLGNNTMLDFSSYFSTPLQCAIPIYVLPDEQVADHFRSFSSKNLKYKFLGLGALLMWACYTSFALEGYYQPKPAFNTFPDLISFPLPDSIEEPVQLRWKAKSDPKKSLYNRFLRDVTPQDKFLIAYIPLLMVLVNEYLHYKFLPSEKLTLKAFTYAQSNYYSNEEAALNIVGHPPLVSTRRGLFSFFY